MRSEKVRGVRWGVWVRRGVGEEGCGWGVWVSSVGEEVWVRSVGEEGCG